MKLGRVAHKVTFDININGAGTKHGIAQIFESTIHSTEE